MAAVEAAERAMEVYHINTYPDGQPLTLTAKF